MFSEINLSGMNALREQEIIAGSIKLSLLAKTFEISLYITLHKLIGLKLVTHSGLSTFGIEAI
jgi:hypothetical protein